MSTKSTENQGFKKVLEVPRNKGKFSSPHKEVLAQPIGVRLPYELKDWIEQEAKRQGINRGDLIRNLLLEQMSERVKQSA